MTTHRTVIEVDLKPLVGQRFQPTGFPDLGAAEFQYAEDKRALLVESTQSIANRLEATMWDEARADQVQELSALPYVRVVDGTGAGSTDACDVRPAVSGGVKRVVVNNEAKGTATAEGYGTVPHHRVEYAAEKITAFFAIDHTQLRSYGLSEPATALLEALVDFE